MGWSPRHILSAAERLAEAERQAEASRRAAEELAAATPEPEPEPEPAARAAPPAFRPPPGATILDAVALLGPLFAGESWSNWRTFLKALFALPLEPAELELYQQHTGRTVAPTVPARECWTIVGRRGGKSRIAALVAVFLACFRDYSTILAPGEAGVVGVLAADRQQAKIVLRYIVGLLDAVPELAALIVERRKESLVLSNGVTVEVHTSNWRAVRGHTCLAAILDETAFWRVDEGSLNPDKEVIDALRPSMATVPEPLLLAISTPYARRGELWRAREKFWGQDEARALVWQADTASMNPTVDPAVIAQAYEDDPSAAASEFGGQFRSDLEPFLALEAVQAVVVAGRRELAPERERRYVAFVDPSGGSQDSFTLAIGHREGERVVLDALREVRPKFSPDAVVEEYAQLCRAYRVSQVLGDRYAGEWPRERFQLHGVRYLPSPRTKSQLYQGLLPALNSGRVALLDHQRLVAQLVGLERRVARGGSDSIDHAPGAHDDLANVVAGVVGAVLGGPEPLDVEPSHWHTVVV